MPQPVDFLRVRPREVRGRLSALAPARDSFDPNFLAAPVAPCRDLIAVRSGRVTTLFVERVYLFCLLPSWPRVASWSWRPHRGVRRLSGPTCSSASAPTSTVVLASIRPELRRLSSTPRSSDHYRREAPYGCTSPFSGI
jgi:hypothetical protein